MLNTYLEFFSKFNVLGLAIGLMIGSNLKEVANTFIDDVLMPFIKPMLKILTGNQGSEEKPDDKSSNMLHFEVPGTDIKINLENVVASGIKFFLLSIIIFFMLQVGIRLKKPVQWVSVRNWDKMPKRRKGTRKGIATVTT